MFLVIYIEGCICKNISFDNELEMYEWCTSFLMSSYSNPDNFIDYIIKGSILKEGLR